MSDIYQTVTDKIVAMLEAGAGAWRMPWHTDKMGLGELPLSMPHNVSGRPYRGVNVPILWAAAQSAGYGSAVWATYKQWQEKGAQVRKGEKATAIVFWKTLSVPAEGDDPERSVLMAKSYSVFNAAQVDGYAAPERAPEEVSDAGRIAAADTYFAAIGATVRHGGNRAFYAPSSDHVQMPRFDQFEEPAAYYATLAHECTHWTSAKSRCDRELGARFGDAAYAMEELIAELGSAFVCADLGLSNEPRPDHAAYLASWLKVLKSDKRAIFTAASKAQAAADYLNQAAAVEVREAA
jgi:antirestriction protein ArdC